MAELSLNNIFINYFGARDVVHSFSHSFCSGLNVIYGEEGSGKTTLLKVIAGLVKPNNGTIFLDGCDYVKAHPRDKGIAMVFDDLAMRGRRSALNNLSLPLRLRKVAPDTINERVSTACRDFGISEHILDSAVFRLTEECRVRLALARAFIRESKVIIFDNPFKRLSPDTREELFLLLLAKIRKSDAIVIYATDNSREVEMTLAPTVIISYGYLTESGYADSFRSAPQTLNTAERFIKYSCSYDIVLDKEGFFDMLGARHYLTSAVIMRLLGANYLGKEVIAVAPPSAFAAGQDIFGRVDNYFATPEGRLAVISTDTDTFNAYIGVEAAVNDILGFTLDTDKIFLYDAQNERVILSGNI